MKYKVTRRRGMKTIRMRMQEDGTILVSAPYGVPREMIEEAVRKSSGALEQGRRTMDEAHDRWQKFVSERLASRQITEERIHRDGEDILVGTPFEKGSFFNGLPLITDLETFQEMFDTAYKNFEKKHPIELCKVTMRQMKSRWGSCRPGTGRMTFNLLLLYVPGNCAAYVIYHELCHFLELNHSRKFWQQVEKYVPDYREREQELRTYGEILISHSIS